ncbi:hypothetical protein KKH56_04250 [bacterium]|nr:hypothetical protein [bacterium]MBU1487246.1 hypothetical protein [bacterium]
MASSEEILLSHRTYSLVKDTIKCRLLGEKKIRGLIESVQVYKVS